MSELVLYGDTQTSRTWWNDWTFRELNLEYENVKFGFLDPEIRSDDFLALHPNGLIPTIKDGDFVLWESMAINLYLAKKSGGPLYPDTLEGEALAWQWSFWGVTRLEVPLLTLLVADAGFSPDSELGQYFLKHSPAWTEDEVARCRGVLERPFQVLDNELAKRPFLLGEEFTVADLNVTILLARNCMAMAAVPGAKGAGISLSTKPLMTAWLDRCWSRPACPRREALLEGLNKVR
jgi:glutathione S-transferase